MVPPKGETVPSVGDVTREAVMVSSCTCSTQSPQPACTKSDSDFHRKGQVVHGCSELTQFSLTVPNNSQFPKENIPTTCTNSHLGHQHMLQGNIQMCQTSHAVSSSPNVCVNWTNFIVDSSLSLPCEVGLQDFENDRRPLLSKDTEDTSLGRGFSKSFSIASCERIVKSFLGSRSEGKKHSTANEIKIPATDSLSFSTVVSDGPICRICHEGERGSEKLVRPCWCCGTLGYTHQKCLEKWLQTKRQDVCELCRYQFHTRRKDRSFKEWLQTPARPRDRRNMVMDVLCFCLLTPMVFTSAWLCLHGAHYYLTYFNNRDLEGLGLIILASVLLIIFLFWSAVSFRYHCSIWNVWRQENQVVHIVVQDRSPSIQSKLISQLSSFSSEGQKHDLNGNVTCCQSSGLPPGATFV